MIELPRQVDVVQAIGLIDEPVRLHVTPAAADWAAAQLPWPASDSLAADAPWLVVVGGGHLIDEAKALKARSPALKLAVVPSLWGSGAEASPVIVLDRGGRKDIQVLPQAVPDLIIWAPELAASVPLARASQACGDAWSHALEAWLSPLADDALRTDLATLIGTLCTLPLAPDPRWFMASALACAGQARASVGLVHGIAHELEGPLSADSTVGTWHHAKLCASYLLPVMRHNASRSDKLVTLCGKHGLDPALIWAKLGQLHDGQVYRQTLPALSAHWRAVLRNPCSRTNCTLVNAGTLEFLLAFDAAA